MFILSHNDFRVAAGSGKKCHGKINVKIKGLPPRVCEFEWARTDLLKRTSSKNNWNKRNIVKIQKNQLKGIVYMHFSNEINYTLLHIIQ